MGRIFGRGKNKEEKEFQRNIVLSNVAGRAQARFTDRKSQLDSMGKSFYLFTSPDVQTILRTYCPHLLPAFDSMNATSKIENQRDRRRLELRIEILLLKVKMEIPDDATDYRSLIEALEVYAHYRILDAIGGYRGKLVTEEIERTTVKVEQPKKKGIL